MIARRALLPVLVGALAVTAPAAHAAAGWSVAGSLATARIAHTATLLGNGKVLVAAGQGNAGLLNSAELYDPASDTWSAAGNLATARAVPTATLLGNGKVLVAGGAGTGVVVPPALSSAELYDPAANAWSGAHALGAARAGHTATLLGDGSVLVAGGFDPRVGELASAERYTPGTDTWGPVGGLITAREDHTATRLANGKVLVAGGAGTNGLLTSAELFDPGTRTWSPAGDLATGREAHTATLLPSGRVLVTGGEGTEGALTSAEQYDPATNAWSPAGSLATPGFDQTATLLPNGKVLVTGGFDDANSVAASELYDPATNTWSPAPALNAARDGHTATLLPDGRVLVAGGANTVRLASAELFTPPTSLGIVPAIAFAAQSVGSVPAVTPVTVTDTGDSPLRITGVSIAGTNAGDFTVVADACTGRVVAVGAACTVSVRFGPSAVGARAAALDVAANTTPETHVVPLSGTGTPPVVCPARPRADGRPVGVTIDKAAKYTNRRAATLTINAPDTATGVVISNDGGFGRPRTSALHATRTYAWTLLATGPERLPKTVYVRFTGACIDPTQSHQDDVILDQTAPRILRARVTPAGPAKGRGAPALLLRARDNASGLNRAQIRYRSGRRTRTFAVHFRGRFKLTASATRVRVRVSDRAGNVSAWKTARRP